MCAPASAFSDIQNPHGLARGFGCVKIRFIWQGIRFVGTSENNGVLVVFPLHPAPNREIMVEWTMQSNVTIRHFPFSWRRGGSAAAVCTRLLFSNKAAVLSIKKVYRGN
jgi:hypothetical protein